MRLARVIGVATATVKHASMNGTKLLVVLPYMADGETPDGDPLLAIDFVGAALSSRAYREALAMSSFGTLRRRVTMVLREYHSPRLSPRMTLVLTEAMPSR